MSRHCDGHQGYPVNLPDKCLIDVISCSYPQPPEWEQWLPPSGRR